MVFSPLIFQMFIQFIITLVIFISTIDSQFINSLINRRPVQCRSFTGELGECRTVASCPWTRWDVRKQRQYACFRNILTIGVCCPSKKSSTASLNLDDSNQQKPVKIKGSNRPLDGTDSTLINQNSLNRPLKELKKNFTVNFSPFHQASLESMKTKNNQKPVIHISISAYTPYMNTTTTHNSSLSLTLNSTSENDLLNLNALPQLNEALLNATISAIKKSYQSADNKASNTDLTEETMNTIHMKVISDQNSVQTTKLTANARTNECGVIKQNYRIVGGHAADEGQYPWMAAIFLERSTNNNKKELQFWCGATLISDQYILSAAHCVSDLRGLKYLPHQIKVRLGTNWIERNQSDNVRPPFNANQYLQEFDVDHIRIHDNFQRNGFLNDIALIKLNKKVEFNERIKCICLPTERDKESDFSGRLATVLGWGSMKYGGIGTNQLQEVTLPIWTNEQCDQRFIQKINKKFLCAGYLAGTKDACQGDSGSPLVILDQNLIWRVQGIVSWGNKCAQPLYSGVYTRVAEFLDWILRNTV